MEIGRLLSALYPVCRIVSQRGLLPPLYEIFPIGEKMPPASTKNYQVCEISPLENLPIPKIEKTLS